MNSRLATLFDERFNIRQRRARQIIHGALLLALAVGFMLCATVAVGFDDVFVGLNSSANLTIAAVPAEDIIAREEGAFISQILTEQERMQAVAQVPPVFDAPDPNVARQQRALAENILLYIDNVRGDTYASLEQQVADINQITALVLDDKQDTVINILQLPDEAWSLVRNEIIFVLERVMRDSIREAELKHARDQLPNQVSPRLSPEESQIITAITADVIRANTFENPEQTALERETARNRVEPQERHFIAGQIVAPANQPIDKLSYEALQELGLLAQTSNRGSRILRALLASALATIMFGLYLSRYERQLLAAKPKTLLLMAALFLAALAIARVFAAAAEIYLLPAAALGILFVAVSKPNIAIMASVGFAFLAGLLGRSPSLEFASLVAAGNISAILGLRNAGRLNNYFLAGLMVGIANVAVVAIFALLIGFEAVDLTNLLYSFVNGLLIVPTVSFAAMYGLTIALNLPTPFKLMDLSQPSKPLLQRLLREAPGTYQHSLQVANLAEQAADAIGADTQLTHVAALYHDVGKMSNPYFFTENQQHIRNPHDALDDPYRSADIIINHVVEGDQIAKSYNLPSRIRDFVREHHGTTRVFVFYKRAQQASRDADDVDPVEFSYPGPIPQSRETAILMLADSCESAIRAVQPETSQDITALVHRIVEDKRNDGQLDASNLTLNELRVIEETFIEVFRGLFHTRIDYAAAVSPAPPRDDPPRLEPMPRLAEPLADAKPAAKPEPTPTPAAKSPVPLGDDAAPLQPATSDLDDDALSAIMEDEPLVDVPPLPKRNGSKNNGDKSRTQAAETKP